jgi:acetolactate synthase-1/2/3 large subunit
MLEHLTAADYPSYDEWVTFCRRVAELLPLDDPENTTAPGYLSPYAFTLALSDILTSDDIFIPCSSGGANSVPMQTFRQKVGQVTISDHGLAAMGYGLGGAIGAALAHPERRVTLIEGDGGFAQNLQELGTVRVNDLNLKIFIFENEGYSSIRMTQKNYFGGEYVGCDTSTGLGFPDWNALFPAFGIPVTTIDAEFSSDAGFREAFDQPGPAAFLVPIDPEQTYWPKITSRITDSGSMESNPLHRMSPDLPEEIANEVFAYLDA